MRKIEMCFFLLAKHINLLQTSTFISPLHYVSLFIMLLLQDKLLERFGWHLVCRDLTSLTLNSNEIKLKLVWLIYFYFYFLLYNCFLLYYAMIGWFVTAAICGFGKISWHTVTVFVLFCFILNSFYFFNFLPNKSRIFVFFLSFLNSKF